MKTGTFTLPTLLDASSTAIRLMRRCTAIQRTNCANLQLKTSCTLRIGRGIPHRSSCSPWRKFVRDHEPMHRQNRRYIVGAQACVAVARRGGAPRKHDCSLVTDMTARKRAEDARELLHAELDHRVKNALATVSAVISHTATGWSGHAPALPAADAVGCITSSTPMPKTTSLQIAVIDIGKHSFHVVGHDDRGAIILRQKWFAVRLMHGSPTCPSA